jgi:hypothetical protein
MDIAASGGPGWTDVLTAVGTVGAVIAAVGIALWTERRSDRRVREERERSDRLLAEQREQEKAAVDDERAHGRAQLAEERRLARDREQRTEAYRVQVVAAYTSVGGALNRFGDLDGSVRRLAAMGRQPRELHDYGRGRAIRCQQARRCREAAGV